MYKIKVLAGQFLLSLSLSPWLAGGTTSGLCPSLAFPLCETLLVSLWVQLSSYKDTS